MLAMANALLNAGLSNSNEKVAGSSEPGVQVIVIGPPLVITPSIGLRVIAETKGAASKRTLINLENILKG